MHWTEPAFVYWVCWTAVVSCFGYTCEAARRVAKRPTLFMALALFAGAWVLAAAAIGVRLDAIKAIDHGTMAMRSGTAVADRAFDVAAFLFVFAGACLAREAPHKGRLQRLQELVQIAALGALFYLVLPQRIPVNPTVLTSTQMAMLTSELLSLLGLVSLGLGVYAVATSRWMIVSALLTLAAYEGLGIYRAWELWALPAEIERPPFAWLGAYAYVVVWCGMTLLVCYLVVARYRSVRLQELQEAAARLRIAPA
jgi:hypothetical protein